ncbi:MAG: hypothetical protein ACI89J_000344 [Hyphomicrobiaceae bacterium]|jgi:hypothetical protein
MVEYPVLGKQFAGNVAQRNGCGKCGEELSPGYQVGEGAGDDIGICYGANAMANLRHIFAWRKAPW